MMLSTLLFYKMLILKVFLHRIFISGTRVVKNYPGSTLPGYPTGTRVPAAALVVTIQTINLTASSIGRGCDDSNSGHFVVIRTCVLST